MTVRMKVTRLELDGERPSVHFGNIDEGDKRLHTGWAVLPIALSEQGNYPLGKIFVFNISDEAAECMAIETERVEGAAI